MSENTPPLNEIETAYVVTVFKDGTFAAHLEQPEEAFVVARPANVTDVLNVSEGLVNEIKLQQLTDRIMAVLVAALNPKVPTPADAVKEKLKERGIEPETPTVS